MAKKEKLSLQEQVDKILEQAEAKGLNTNFFFRTTMKRYQVQLKTLGNLEKAIEEHGATVTKTYVKNRENLVVNPAITEYNKTSTAANGTVATLMNIIKNLSEENEAEGKLQALFSSLNESE